MRAGCRTVHGHALLPQCLQTVLVRAALPRVHVVVDERVVLRAKGTGAAYGRLCF
jgi:hypothetical protein